MICLEVILERRREAQFFFAFFGVFSAPLRNERLVDAKLQFSRKLPIWRERGNGDAGKAL